MYKKILMIFLGIQIAWYVLYFVGVLGKVEAQSEVAYDAIALGVPFISIILANGLIITRKKLDPLAVSVILLGFSILCFWLYTVFISGA